MDDLTLEVAERCAKAIGWESFKSLRPAVGRPKDDDSGSREWGIPIRKEGGLVEYVWKAYQLDLDPYFWFPRLWDRLDARCREASDRVHVYWFTMNSAGIITIDRTRADEDVEQVYHGSMQLPCPTLCEAIEALEGK